MRTITRLFLLTLCCAAGILAQTSGTITGTVTDSSKAVIAGVQVSAHGKTVEAQRTVTTNNSGEYALAFLPPGEYEVEFHRDGFATVVEKVTVNVTERIAVNATLQPSTVNEKIEVSASGDVLQTETAALGRVVNSQAVQQLPLATYAISPNS